MRFRSIRCGMQLLRIGRPLLIGEAQQFRTLNPNSAKESKPMKPEDNQAIIKHYAEDVWNGGNLAAIERYVAPNYVRHQPGLPMPIEGQGALRQLVAIYRGAFPDIHFTLEVMVADEEKVAALWR